MMFKEKENFSSYHSSKSKQKLQVLECKPLLIYPAHSSWVPSRTISIIKFQKKIPKRSIKRFWNYFLETLLFIKAVWLMLQIKILTIFDWQMKLILIIGIKNGEIEVSKHYSRIFYISLKYFFLECNDSRGAKFSWFQSVPQSILRVP